MCGARRREAARYITSKGRQRRVMNHFVIRHIGNASCHAAGAESPAQTCTHENDQNVFGCVATGGCQYISYQRVSKRETGGFNSSSLSRSRLSDWDVQTQGRFDSKHIFFSHCRRSWQLNPSTLFCWRIFNLWAGHLRQTGGKIWFIHNRDSRSRAVTGACERLDPM